MQNARHPKTHRELCELACRFLRNNGFKVVFGDRFHAWTPCGEHPDALGFRNGASCLIEVKCSRSDFLADRKKGKRLARTVLIFTERSDQLSRATDRVPGLPANPGYAQ